MKKEKVDKGFELVYYNLSYRRRFIRTLWMIPWSILALFWMYWLGISTDTVLLLAVIFTAVNLIQARHNYKKWKEETKSITILISLKQ